MNVLPQSRNRQTIGDLRRHLFYEHFGFSENPFGVTSNPKYLYESRTHGEAEASLVVGLECGMGFQALIAPPGMGKTTILFHVVQRFRDVAQTVFLFQIPGASKDFLHSLLWEMGSAPSSSELTGILNEVNQVLLKQFRAGRRVILVIDEAQNLGPDILEVVRLLSNFETASEKLLQIILAGQPQLAQKLARPNMVQLRQRISTFMTLVPFTLEETDGYIEHRLKVAGRVEAGLFSPAAVELTWQQSQGVPRDINTLCLNALLLGSSRNLSQIDRETIAEVAADRDMRSLRRSGRNRSSVKLATPSNAVPQKREPPGNGAAVEEGRRDSTCIEPESPLLATIPSPPTLVEFMPTDDAPLSSSQQRTDNLAAGAVQSDGEDQERQLVRPPVMEDAAARSRWLPAVLAVCLIAFLLLGGTNTADSTRGSPFPSKQLQAGVSSPVYHAEQQEKQRLRIQTADANENRLVKVTALEHFSNGSSTTIAIALGHEVVYNDYRLSSPDRVYFDLENTLLSPELAGKPMPVGELAVSRIRVAQHEPGVTRIAVVTKGWCDYSKSFASNPPRLLIQFWPRQRRSPTTTGGDSGHAR